MKSDWDVFERLYKSLPAPTLQGALAELEQLDRRASARVEESARVVTFFASLGYQVSDQIGKGGAGYVFLVTQESAAGGKGPAALKALRHDIEDDFADRIARFSREVEVLRRLKDISVPRIVFEKTDGEYPLFVMEYIAGENLGQLAKRKGRLEAAVALELTLQAALVIEELDRRHIVHRDIKPANLILDQSGKLWVVDFGLARKRGTSDSAAHTRKDAHLGTMFFTAPEQETDPTGVDSRADVYGLGCTLYYLLFGEFHQHQVNPAEKAKALRHPDLQWAEDGRDHHLLEEMLAASPGARLTPEELVKGLRTLLTPLRRRDTTLLDVCANNVRSVTAVRNPNTRDEDIDRRRLLQLCHTTPAERDRVDSCTAWVDGLEQDRLVAPVEATALRLLVRRNGEVTHTWGKEPELVVRYRPRGADRERVLKVVRTGAEGSDGDPEEYFRVAQRVTHLGVAPVREIGREGTMFFVDMEYVDGKTLFSYRREVGTLVWAEVKPIFDTILAALTGFHHLGITHGDIQPSCVILPPAGAGAEAVIIGFGNAPASRPQDDLRRLGCLLLFLITGREPAADDLTPGRVAEQFGPTSDTLPDGLDRYVTQLLDGGMADIDRARAEWSRLSAPTVAPPGKVAPDHTRFQDLLQEFGGSPEVLPRAVADAPPDPTDRVPRFLLFRRSGQVIMAVIPGHGSADPFGLQTTTEAKSRAELLPESDVVTLGFTPGEVHTSFLDPADNVVRIIVDALFLVDAILRPTGRVLIPGSQARGAVRVRTTIDAWLNAMFRMHGTRKVFFANAATGAWPDDVLVDYLHGRPVCTRFAPTPSGGLHLGNARTALASFLVALRSGLRHSPAAPTSHFHVRVDDTDLDRCRPGAEEQIKEELQWLGVTWDKSNEFKQSDEPSRTRYHTVEQALRATGLLAYDNTTQVSSLDLDGADHDYGKYYNVLFDLKRGPRVFHAPPTTRGGDAKVIELTRADGTPFYRFAGCIDDIARTTVAFRDRGQFGLSEIQSHIRYGIERLRLSLQRSRAASPERERLARNLHKALGLEEGVGSIPLVAYGHIQVLVDEAGDKLSKRDHAAGDANPFVLQTLRAEGVGAEAVAAYLLTTLIPRAPGTTPSDQLRDLIQLFALGGLAGGLMMVAPDIDLFRLVRSEKEIQCHPVRLRRANRMLIRALPPWRAGRLFEAVADPPGAAAPLYPDRSEATRARVYAARGEFADFRQIQDAVRGPTAPPDLDPESVRLIRVAANRYCNHGEPAALLVHSLREQLKALRVQAQDGDGPRGRLHTTLADLRRLLTGAAHSARVETILDVLDPAVVRDRVYRLSAEAGLRPAR